MKVSKKKRTLEEVIADVRRCLEVSAEAKWNRGKYLAEIKDGDLWKSRVDDAGRQLYPSFDLFVKREFNLTLTAAYGAIATSKVFSVEEVRAIGWTNAKSIAGAHPDDRGRILALAKSGASTRQIKGAVTESRERTGYFRTEQAKQAYVAILRRKEREVTRENLLEEALRTILKKARTAKSVLDVASIARVAKKALAPAAEVAS